MLPIEEQKENQILYVVEKEDHGKDIKQVLKKRLSISSRLLTKLKKDKNIMLNGQYVKYHEIIQAGDLIKILMKEEPSQFEPQAIPFHVVYEDMDLIVINKQPGIVSHPTRSHPDQTVANGATYYVAQRGLDCKIRFVNRLDMDTSGLLMLAKNPFAHHVLSEQMKENQIKKKYITFVKGVVEEEEGRVEAPIYRPTDDAVKRVVDERGQPSITKYRVLERYKDATMLEVELLTGRTHQIRVHMEYLGYPMLGDHLYGYENKAWIERQALHASSLQFLQPRFKERIHLTAPIPGDLQRLRHLLMER